MIRRIFGPDPVSVRVRLLAVETIAAAGITAVIYLAARIVEQ